MGVHHSEQRRHPNDRHRSQDVSNVTEVCSDDDGPFDLVGRYRRAPSEPLFRWSDDQAGRDEAGRDVGGGLEAVSWPLALGALYSFRVRPLLPSALPPAAGEAGPAVTTVTDTPSNSADPVDPADPVALMTLVEGLASAYSEPLRVSISGPGRPVHLEVDRVGPHTLQLRWRRPMVNPQASKHIGGAGCADCAGCVDCMLTVWLC